MLMNLWFFFLGKTGQFLLFSNSFIGIYYMDEISFSKLIIKWNLNLNSKDIWHVLHLSTLWLPFCKYSEILASMTKFLTLSLIFEEERQEINLFSFHSKKKVTSAPCRRCRRTWIFDATLLTTIELPIISKCLSSSKNSQSLNSFCLNQ